MLGDRTFKVNGEGSDLMNDCWCYCRYGLAMTGVSPSVSFCWHDIHHPLSTTSAPRNLPQPWDTTHPNTMKTGHGPNPWFSRSVRSYFSQNTEKPAYVPDTSSTESVILLKVNVWSTALIDKEAWHLSVRPSPPCLQNPELMLAAHYTPGGDL